MKRFVVLLITLLLVGVIGCNGNGNNNAVGSEESPSDPGDTGPEGIILAIGTATIAKANSFYVPFTVGETGKLEGRVTWSGGPDKLWVNIQINGIQIIVKDVGPSPISISGKVTQDILDSANSWEFFMANGGQVPANVEYRLKFTPN